MVQFLLSGLFVFFASLFLTISSLLPRTTLPPQRVLQHISILYRSTSVSSNISSIGLFKPEIILLLMDIGFILVFVFFFVLVAELGFVDLVALFPPVV